MHCLPFEVEQPIGSVNIFWSGTDFEKLGILSYLQVDFFFFSFFFFEGGGGIITLNLVLQDLKRAILWF